MAKGKPHMNIVFIGHVDHGKSTTVGRLLYDTGNIDEQAMRKLQKTPQTTKKNKNGGMGGRGAGNHVLDEILVPRCVDNCKIIFCRFESFM